MVALSPRFTFLATLCALAALYSAPISDAAVLPLRASDLASTEMTSNYARSGASTFLSRRSSHVVGDAPVLPLPKGLGGSQKNSANFDDSPSGSPSGGDPYGEKDAFTDEDTAYDGSGAASTKGRKSKAKDRRWNMFGPMKLLSASWFGDNRIHYARAPHHDHHHHHHHHHHDRRHRGLRTRRSEPGPDNDPSSSAITPGHDEHVHVGRSPHHHHNHHHHHNGYKKVIVSGDHDHVRVDRSRRSYNHHHHHHNGHKKVVVSGDHDHVRVDRSLDQYQGGNAIISGDDNHAHRRRSVFIAGEQGQSYVVPRATKRSSVQELLTVSPLKKRADGMDCAPGYIHIMSPSEDGGNFLASLVLSSTDSTSSDNSTTSPPEFTLNASEMDMTPMCLQASSYNTSDSGLTSDEVGVTLLVEMFDATSASIVPYCATFDPDPPAPAPLTAEKCTDNPVGEYRSQLFSFNRATGVVRPMWFKAQDDGSDSENKGCARGDDQATPQSSPLPNAAEEDGDSTPDADQADQALINDLAARTADSPQTAPSDSSEGSISGAQNVALVFVAMDPVVVDTPGNADANLTSVSATATGVQTSSSASTIAVPSTSAMTTPSPTTQVAVSSSGSVSASTISSAGLTTSVSAVVSSGSPTSVPSSTGLVSGARATPSKMLGVQVVPESASDAASSASEDATPAVTPMGTQPYEWMFTLDS